MSETAAAREDLAPFCSEPFGMDVGFGGDRIVPHAWAFDMPTPYTSVGDERQQVRGDCRQFPFLANGALDWLYSSHLLEDFAYGELITLLGEWRRVIKPGGLLITNCPDQQRFLNHCAATGQGLNLAHKEETFGLDPFRKCLQFVGDWEEVYVKEEAGAYSWYLVVRKVGS